MLTENMTTQVVAQTVYTECEAEIPTQTHVSSTVLDELLTSLDFTFLIRKTQEIIAFEALLLAETQSTSISKRR